MPPLIGLTMARSDDGLRDGISVAYLIALRQAGGIAVALPNGTTADVLSRLDGLILTGGGDFAPERYARPNRGTKDDAICPERDQTEIELIRAAQALHMPMLGICRGIQALAVALGGTLIQDISQEMARSDIVHYQTKGRSLATHGIHVLRPSRLFDLAGSAEIRVNSLHHQAVEFVPEGFTVVATAEDGLIEAMEGPGRDFVMGVQWHPEDLAVAGDVVSQRIFATFVTQASMFKTDTRRG